MSQQIISYFMKIKASIVATNQFLYFWYVLQQKDAHYKVARPHFKAKRKLMQNLRRPNTEELNWTTSNHLHKSDIKKTLVSMFVHFQMQLEQRQQVKVEQKPNLIA